MDAVEGRRFRFLLGGFLVLVVAGGLIDLILDHRADGLTLHAIYELMTLLAALGMAGIVWRGWWRTERSVAHLQTALAQRSHERDQWQHRARKALETFSAEVDEQFRAWSLTPAEREVAFLLLKGNSHKQIGQETGRSDRTVRQHAGTVYQKAGLASRAELAAFFMKELKMPEDASAVGRLEAGEPGPLTTPSASIPSDAPAGGAGSAREGDRPHAAAHNRAAGVQRKIARV